MSWNTVKFNGIGARHVTVTKGGTITLGTHEGQSCYVHTDGTLYVGDSDKALFGVIKAIGTSQITVQDQGYAEVSYTGSAPTVGSYNNLECGASGTVQVDASNGVPMMVMSVDTDASTCVIKLP